MESTGELYLHNGEIDGKKKHTENSCGLGGFETSLL